MAFALNPVLAFPTGLLTEQERQRVAALQMSLYAQTGDLNESWGYYIGTQAVKNLRIAIPEELEAIRTIVGWGATAVDPYVERISVEGFRTPDATDADVHAGELWRNAGGDALLPMATTDALAMGRAWWFVGSGKTPQIAVESPLNVAAEWGLDGTLLTVLRRYIARGRERAALYTPDETVQLARDDDYVWQIVSRDRHNMGVIPAVPMVNRPTTATPGGASEITRPLRSIIDMGCSVMLQLRVAGELYSVPKEIILGATEGMFQNADGSPRTAWQAFLTRLVGLERDDEGNLPDIKQLQAYDPSVYTKVLEHLASQAAGILAAPPQDLGLYTNGNPVTAESVTASESRRDRRAQTRQRMFAGALTQVVRLMLRIENNGVLPTQYERIGVDWTRIGAGADLMTSQGIQLQIQSGAVPPTSDVTLGRLGYDALDRQRLAQDRVTATGEQTLREIASANQG